MLNPEVLNILIEWKNECRLTTIGVKTTYANSKHYLTIFTDRPGFMIGKQGCTFYKYRDKILAVAHNRWDDIDIKEVGEFISLSEQVDVDAYYKKYFDFSGEL